jgi:uncharacterized protein (TIGR00725 family)
MMESSLSGRYVAVIGPGSDLPREQVDAAYEIGRQLAARGAVILTGGLGGIMQAAAAGAQAAAGTSIGLLPGRDRTLASPEHTLALPTGMGEMRNALLVRSADLVVAVGCSWGTLSEIALAIRTGVPLVHLYGWADYRSEGVAAESPEEAVRRVEEILHPDRG